MKKKYILLFSILFILIIKISFYFYDNYENSKIINSIHKKIYANININYLNNIKVKNENIENPERIHRKQILSSLKKENSDLIGYIRIKNSSIDYPVMQDKSGNNFYFNHDFYKNKRIAGSIFIDELNNLNDNNIIIYGHHMKSDQMFHFLENYKKKETYENYKTIEFDTLDNINDYKIISCFKINKKEREYLNTILLDNFDKLKEFIIRKKMYDTEYDLNKLNSSDKLITLITCEYSNTNGRLVVIAIRQ